MGYTLVERNFSKPCWQSVWTVSSNRVLGQEPSTLLVPSVDTDADLIYAAPIADSAVRYRPVVVLMFNAFLVRNN